MAANRVNDRGFVRSPSLDGWYKAIGCGLLRYEETTRGLRSLFDPSGLGIPISVSATLPCDSGAMQEFREEISFVPAEALEQYLDDLLDTAVIDEDLHIAKDRAFSPLELISAAGVCISVLFGIYSFLHGSSALGAFLSMACIGLPFALLWLFAPKDKLCRRMRFARIVSGEIARRKGGGGPFIRNAGGTIHAFVGKEWVLSEQNSL